MPKGLPPRGRIHGSDYIILTAFEIRDAARRSLFTCSDFHEYIMYYDRVVVFEDAPLTGNHLSELITGVFPLERRRDDLIEFPPVA